MKENNKKDEVEKDDKKVISSENEKKLEEDIKESAAQENNDEAPENKNNNEESEDSVEKLFETIDLLKDEKLRLLAEMENLRKRSEKEKLDYIKYGSSNLARDILALDDNLARALESFDDQSKIIVAIFNEKSLSEIAITKKYAGIGGHYLLLNNATVRKHLEFGQKIGVGYPISKNSLFREINRGVEWIFCNDAEKLFKIIKTELHSKNIN